MQGSWLMIGGFSEKRGNYSYDLKDTYNKVDYALLLTLLIEFGIDARLVG